MSLLIIVMDNTILNVAIPSLIRDLDASNSQIQWIIDSYVLVFAGLLLTTGSLTDRFGRKGALQARLVLFALGSIGLGARSTRPTQLIFTRAFMGIGGALIMPSTLSILTNVFRDPKERGRAIAIWAGFSGLAVAIGPMTGGLLLEHFSWSSVFWVNIPVAAVALGARRVHHPHVARPTAVAGSIPLGAVLSIVGLATLLFGIIEGPSKGWASTEVDRRLRDRRRHAHRASCCGSATPSSPMLDMSACSRTPLHGCQQHDHAHVLRPVRVDVPDDPVLAARPRLLAVRGRRAACSRTPATMMVVAPLSARVVEKVGTKRVVLAGLGLIIVGPRAAVDDRARHARTRW